MSLTKNDRKLQSKFGKTFPNETRYDGALLGQLIGKALTAQFGQSPAAIKTVGRLTNSSERAVRNWFEGKNGPSGENLITLIRHSDEVLQTVLALSGRRELGLATNLVALRRQMQAMIGTIDGLDKDAAPTSDRKAHHNRGAPPESD